MLSKYDELQIGKGEKEEKKKESESDLLHSKSASVQWPVNLKL